MYSTKWEIAIPTGRLPEARAAFRERLVPALNGTPGLVRLLVPTEGGHSFTKLDESGRHIDADGYLMDCYALWETKAVMRANLGRLFTEGTRILGDATFFAPSERRGAHYEVLVIRDGGTGEGMHAARTDIPCCPSPRKMPSACSRTRWCRSSPSTRPWPARSCWGAGPDAGVRQRVEGQERGVYGSLVRVPDPVEDARGHGGGRWRPAEPRPARDPARRPHGAPGNSQHHEYDEVILHASFQDIP